MADPSAATILAPGSGLPDPVAEATPSFSPLYQQIKELLLRSLQGGEWKPGEVIPSEIDLATRYKVSQGTVRKAIDELATDNLLVRRQGKGTFVATHAEERTQYRFLRLQRDDGAAAGMRRRFLDCRRLRAPAEVARALGLKASESVWQVRRLPLAQSGGRPPPVVFAEDSPPGATSQGPSAERLSGQRGPMYAFFEAEFGVRMIRADEKVRAVAADDEAARLLEVGVGAPLLSVERLSYPYGDRPVELRRGLYHTAAHHYRNQLN